MSFHTIFVLIDSLGVAKVSQALDPNAALDELRHCGLHGEMYACVMSEAAATEVNAAVQPSKALTLCKRYSHSMMKCADIT